MPVETYECSETASEPIEATEEAVALIEELGLTGQKKLVTRHENSTHDIRSPYRKIRQDEVFVYGTICPKIVLLSDYDAGPVPLRVLQVAAHAKGLFRFLKVAYQADSAVKDPVLLGSENNYTFSWSYADKDCILARWGDELETFQVLLKRATDLARESLVQSAESVLAQVKSATSAQLLDKGPGVEVRW